jgi:LPPG:FO 2-phospho-L-lactate transferase
MSAAPKYLALTGGVGGAKLGVGLAHILPPSQLAFLVNTGDDFTHLGLHISPDLDTLMYALSGESNVELGWGRRDESWRFIETLRALGGESWFNLGDRDLAVHVLRSERLRAGESLSSITQKLNAALGTQHPVWPMCEEPVPTIVHTLEGPLAFQHYFVRDRCAPAVTGFEFRDAAAAQPLPQLLDWLADPALAVESLCEYRSDSGDPGRAGGDAGQRRAYHCRVAHRGGPRHQGANGQNDGRTCGAGQRARGGATLRGFAHRLCGR